MPYKDKARQRAYQRDLVWKRRSAWILENGPCRGCGATRRLEVHHKDPAQKVSHRIWGWSQVRRDAELAKCEVRCWECHHRPHHAEMDRKVNRECAECGEPFRVHRFKVERGDGRFCSRPCMYKGRHPKGTRPR